MTLELGTIRYVSTRTQSRTRIGALVSAFGWTQDQAADKVGIDRVHMNRLCTGRLRASRYDLREKLAHGFGILLPDLADYLDWKIELAALLERVAEAKRQLALQTAKTAENVKLRLLDVSHAALGNAPDTIGRKTVPGDGRSTRRPPKNVRSTKKKRK